MPDNAAPTTSTESTTAIRLALTKPFTPPGADKPVEALELDFARIDGNGVLKAARLADMRRGEPAPSAFVDPLLHLEVASLAAGLDSAVLAKLPAPDFVRLLVLAQGFLMGVA